MTTIRRIRWVGAAWVALLLVCVPVTCQAVSPSAERELLAAYVPPAFGDETSHVSFRTLHVTPGDSAGWTLTPARRQKLSEGQQWVRFEEEFGVQNRSDSWMLSGIQSAKYHFDKTVFALDLLAENVERALQLEYNLARGQMQLGAPPPTRPAVRTYHDLWRDVWENARIKSDVDLDIFSGRAWVGLRLVIPFGD
jgi:hypothetical protein